MTEAESDDDAAKLDGLPVERAAASVTVDEANSDEIRETLAIVARDGVVRRAAVDDAVANASMVATTAETRVELAGEKLDSAREAAAPVSGRDLVSARVDTFDARLDAIEDRADELGDAIQEALAMKAGGDLFEIARRIRRVTSAATEIQRAADDLQFELDSFEEWLTDADRRVEELTADLDALAESVGELDDVAETLAVDDRDPGSETARTWAAAMVRHRVASLMIADLRAELAALRTWAERDGGAPPSDIEPRLDEIQASHDAVGAQLTANADPKWTARFDDQLTALDEALEAMEPPVAWTEVEAVVEEHRPAIE
ncbi:halo transducer protein [Halorubrum salsamenti]|uniref:halo transducer protein n=1 Tax=Halorubrum salsamenti TaxID=2583990 RepID=UPI0011A4DB29